MTMPTTNSELTGEPALWLGFASGAVQLAAAFFLPWPDETVAIINAALAAAFGVWIALRTKANDNGGAIKAAILGAGQALINLALVFGWHATDKQTASLMMFIALASAAFIRQTSKAKGEPAGRGLHSDKPLSSM